MKIASLAPAAALAAILAAPGVLADDTQASMDAMRVVRDKDSGALRAPNSEELRAMMEAEKADRAARRALGEKRLLPEQVIVRTFASGMKSAQLSEEYLVNVVATRDADGKLVVSHANPADEHVAPAHELPTE
jgi:hypothetical protein